MQERQLAPALTGNFRKTIDFSPAFQDTISMILQDVTIRHLRKSIDLPNHAHELTFSCYRRYKLLSKDRTRQWFVDSLDQARRKHDFHVWNYVIMPEHVHVTLLPQRSNYKISDILHSIKKPVSNKAMNYLRRTNPRWLERLTVRQPSGKIERHFWQPGGGYDRNIVTMRALAASIFYVHANPVRRSLAVSPTDWEWSSARWYEGERDVKLRIDATMSHLMV